MCERWSWSTSRRTAPLGQAEPRGQCAVADAFGTHRDIGSDLGGRECRQSNRAPSTRARWKGDGAPRPPHSRRGWRSGSPGPALALRPPSLSVGQCRGQPGTCYRTCRCRSAWTLSTVARRAHALRRTIERAVTAKLRADVAHPPQRRRWAHASYSPCGGRLHGTILNAILLASGYGTRVRALLPDTRRR